MAFSGAHSAGIPLTICLVAGAGCQAGSGQTLELKLAHSGAPESLIAISAEEFARRANERLGKRATVTVFGSSQLGGDQVVLQKLKLGTVDMSIPSTVLSSVIDAFALFEMPYLVRDREHMRSIVDQVFWPYLEPRAETQGYKVLAVWENGFRHVTSNTRPIVTPADLRGIKLRTPKSPWRMKLFQTFGANPTPLPFSDVFMALKTGVVDGQENPLTNIVTAKLYEVQKYLSLTGHIYSPAYLTVGLERWQALPQDVRDILEQTASETTEFVMDAARRIDAELLERLEQTGIRINRPDRDAFRNASQPVYDEFGSTVEGGAAIVAAALAAVRDSAEIP
ncbi:MAG: TRAP transporter substrate-binding protein [Gemmatimonadales bacterium]